MSATLKAQARRPLVLGIDAGGKGGRLSLDVRERADAGAQTIGRLADFRYHIRRNDLNNCRFFS